jgi:hypothetical protein
MTGPKQMIKLGLFLVHFPFLSSVSFSMIARNRFNFVFGTIEQAKPLKGATTRAIRKVRRLAAVRRCSAEGGGDLCQVVVVELM